VLLNWSVLHPTTILWHLSLSSLYHNPKCTFHQHCYSMLQTHCSSTSTNTPLLDHHLTSTTGPCLHPWHHYTINSPTLHHHTTTTNNTTQFFSMKPSLSLHHYISTNTNTPSPYYCTSTSTNSPLIIHIFQHNFITTFTAHHYISSTSPIDHHYIKTSSTSLF